MTYTFLPVGSNPIVAHPFLLFKFIILCIVFSFFSLSIFFLFYLFFSFYNFILKNRYSTTSYTDLRMYGGNFI